MTSRSGTKRGWFITFEGPEGSGKSTQLRTLGKKLRGKNYAVLETAEPCSTPIGLQIRRVLLDAKNQELCPTAELLILRVQQNAPNLQSDGCTAGLRRFEHSIILAAQLL